MGVLDSSTRHKENQHRRMAGTRVSLKFQVSLHLVHCQARAKLCLDDQERSTRSILPLDVGPSILLAINLGEEVGHRRQVSPGLGFKTPERSKPHTGVLQQHPQSLSGEGLS